MKVKFSKEFDDDLDNITDVTLAKRVGSAIEKMESASSIQQIPNIKKMQGYSIFYRHRFGDYRIGFELIDKNTIRLLSVDHRNDFYRYFPKSFA
jgi:mRNA interferase RelE/StbE